MCLRYQGIDDDGGGIDRVRRSRRLINNSRGVVRGQVIDNASEGLETSMEVVGDRRRSRGIYDKYRGVGGGRLAQILQQRQRRRR